MEITFSKEIIFFISLWNIRLFKSFTVKIKVSPWHSCLKEWMNEWRVVVFGGFFCLFVCVCVLVLPVFLSLPFSYPLVFNISVPFREIPHTVAFSVSHRVQWNYYLMRPLLCPSISRASGWMDYFGSHITLTRSLGMTNWNEGNHQLNPLHL